MTAKNLLLENIPSSDAEMGVLVERYAGVPGDAKPGDMLAFPRSTGYSHYAVYLGNGEVMDIVTKGPAAIKAFIQKRLVSEVADGSKVYVQNQDHHGKRPLPPDEIVRRALEDENKWVSYNFLGQNCEHRSSSWRYGGQGNSRQVAKPLDTPIGQASAIAIGVMAFLWMLARGIFLNKSESNSKKKRQDNL